MYFFLLYTDGRWKSHVCITEIYAVSLTIMQPGAVG